MPTLPVALAQIIVWRLLRRFVTEDRVEDARRARPDIGVASMLGCGVVYSSAWLCWSSPGAGLMALLVLWMFWACAAHVARCRVLQHVHLQGAEQLVIIDVLVALTAAYSGTFWSAVIAGFSTIAILRCSITLPLNLPTLAICSGTITLGLSVGHYLTREPRAQIPRGANVPLLFEGGGVAERVVRRLQVARSVRAQVVRSLRRERCAACTLACCVAMAILYVCSRSAYLCLIALCCWQLCVNCAGRVVMRRLHVQWYVHMFESDL